MPDLGDVAKSLVRVIDAVTPEVIDHDAAVLETLIRHVGVHGFRRRILRSRSVEFNFEMEGMSATVSQDASRGIASSSGNAAPPAKPDETIYWPRAEEVLREAFDATEGGVQYVFVGEGFWKFLKERKLMDQGKLGPAQVIMLPRQPDRDVFLVGKITDVVLDIEDIPEDRMARVTVISNDASFMHRPKKVGDGQRLLTLDEQRKYMNSMPEDQRNTEMAVALENVRDHTAKSTIRSLFPQFPEDQVLKTLKAIRKIRPCAVQEMEPTEVGGHRPPRRIDPGAMARMMGQDGKVVGRVGEPIRRTTVTEDTKIPDDES